MERGFEVCQRIAEASPCVVFDIQCGTLHKWCRLKWRGMQRFTTSWRIRKQGLSKFDPRNMERDLKNGKNITYCYMIGLADTPAEKLASWSEACPCHEPMVKHLSQLQREKLFEAHYGPGFKSCPVSGCMASFIAAGCLDDMLDAMWERQEGKVASLQLFEGAPPISAGDLQDVLDDFKKARLAMTVYLQLKLVFWTLLPYLIAGLGHVIEAIAMKVGENLLAAMQAEPREEAHDPLTWALLNPDAPFLHELLRFVSGAARALMSDFYLQVVAIFKSYACN